MLTDKLTTLLSDKAWRLRHLYLILPEDTSTAQENTGIIPLVLRAEQETFMQARHTRNFVPKARKLGMSTFIVIDYLDECLWNKDTHCAHVDFRKDDAAKKLAIARLAWERGPEHPNPAIAEIWRGLHAKLKLVKSNDSCLAWSNGSHQEANMSFMGGTPRRLHISEYGPLAAQRPEAAARVRQGSFNAVPATGIIDIETTMEGGPIGECYEIFRLACDATGRQLSPLDWKLHFFPWYHHPSYTLPHHTPRKPETERYFRELKSKHNITIPLERQAWYERKAAEQRESMYTQFPSTADECVKATTRDPIYPEITLLRTQGRVKDFSHERSLPLFTAWDLGISDYTSGWLIQPSGRDLLILAWHEGEGHGAANVADVIRNWESQFSRRIAMHYLPHDANIREKGSGRTYIDQLAAAGISRHSIRIVPRTPDIWTGINDVRDILPKCWFHTRTDQPRKSLEGRDLPSGLQCLEAYRKQPPTPGGALRPMPLHDACSHSADAFRTFAEAHAAGLITTHTGHEPKPKVLMGVRGA
ncbi:hypothetical protein [Roseimicrobium sp. ORNL1]|uniref:hypothetical protein n=1 Tax=Roseimicrobium sp. ORNL1 TaxID=2711231 RepID=UPI0013E10422|nr:hypothetical protein [Roseimicrobium sp. ORNL1]QIF01946.1 hypothetical protein G5S37_10535 [Roseimicrobium sp. ORNL1]